MTASAVLTSTIPVPRSPGDDRAGAGSTRGTPSLRNGFTSRAVAYQRVLHQLVRRELRLLGELATWAPADEAERTATLTRHAELIGRVLLHHHSIERESVWPALLRTVPDAGAEDIRGAVEHWTDSCARIDHMLRDVATAARQWAVAGTRPARDAFAMACLALAAAVEEQTRDEERTLLPLLEAHLAPEDWAAIAHSAHCRLSAREQLLVLGLALEDSCAADRARLIDGLSRSTRTVWRLYGGRQFRAAVVRLRGAPPAA
jgi:hypothetical protein